MNTKVIDVGHKRLILDRASRIVRLKPGAVASKSILSLHCMGMDNFLAERSSRYNFVHVYPFIDRIEVKPEKFRGPDTLFFWRGGSYLPHADNHQRLLESRQSYSLRAQFHFPFTATRRDIALTMSNPDHHGMLLEMFAAYAAAIPTFHYDQNITLHPPDIRNHLDDYEIRSALENMNKFLILLGEAIVRERWNMTVCVENQPEPQGLTRHLEPAGYNVSQLRWGVAGTNNSIQFTVDAGHRKLSVMGVEDIVTLCRELGKYIAEFHIHSNSGRQPDSISAGESLDKHEPMYPWNIHGCYMYLIRSILEDLPFNLEIRVSRFDKDTMVRYFRNLREEIDRVYDVLTGHNG